MRVTIQDVADRAGVHRATVDKVLHHREGVSDEVRMRVQKVIEEMGYTPNPAGQVLQRQGRKFRIDAILVDVDALPFLIQGIKKGVSEQVGFDIEVHYSISKFQEAEKQSVLIDRAVTEKTDGIILSPCNADCVREAVDRAVKAGIMVVMTNSDITGTKRSCYVGIDNLQGSRIAGRLMGLFLRGKGKIAIISSAIDTENNNYGVKTREEGFIRFLSEKFPDISIVSRIESREDSRITYEESLKLLRTNEDLQGIYITCGGTYEVGRALRESGRVGKITVISYEDYPDIKDLIRDEVFNCTLEGDLESQGSIPVTLIMDYLVFGRRPRKEQIFTDIHILVKESLDDYLNNDQRA